MDVSLLADKIVLVTGGTGSFGKAISKMFTTTSDPPREVRILSRHEDLQHEMQRIFPQFKYLIGDVRDPIRLREVLRNVDVVFHAAALKQVPDSDLHPMEAVKTNIFGSQNVRTAAIENHVETVIYISTDKAVKPVNAMGMTKAIQERLFTTWEFETQTRFVGVRYGNIIGSRGSVVPYFVDLAKQAKDLPVTDQRMTRFLLTLQDALELVFFALKVGRNREIMVRKSPAARIIELAEVIADSYGVETEITGIRPGEKIHETIIHEDEMRRSEEKEDYFVIHPRGDYSSDLAYEEYRSDNAKQLDKAGIKKLLTDENWLQRRASSPNGTES